MLQHFASPFTDDLYNLLGLDQAGAERRIENLQVETAAGIVDRVDKNGAVIVKDLFEKNSDMTRFLNMKLISPDNEVGNIEGPFGKSGKVKVSLVTLEKLKKR